MVGNKGIRNLFEELNILDLPPEANPLDTLGVSRDLATELLAVDPTGEALQLAAKGMFRTLSNIYHPDTGTANVDRLIEAQEAHEKLQGASATTIKSWVSRSTSASEKNATIAQKEKAEMRSRAGNFMKRLITDVDNPLSFINFPAANGLVVKAETFVLLQPANNDQLRITPATNTWRSEHDDTDRYRHVARDRAEVTSNVLAFTHLDAAQKGYNPDDTALVYRDEQDKVFVYNKALEPISDASELLAEVVAYLKSYPKTDAPERQAAEHAHSVNFEWAIKPGPTLIRLGSEAHRVEVHTFTERDMRKRQKRRSTLVSLGNYSLVGSLEGNELIDHRKTRSSSQEKLAIASNDARLSLPISLLPFEYEDLLQVDNPGYTPKLLSGNRPVVRDNDSGQLSVVRAGIYGLLRTSL